jgi:predicted aspartyl protease
MGITTLTVRLANESRPDTVVDQTMLVDSGAIFSVVPGDLLRGLGIQPHGKERFFLADGSAIEREVGTVFFEIEGARGASKTIFGEPGDAALLGAITLESLGLMLDPLKRQLRPMRLLLAGVATPIPVPC